MSATRVGSAPRLLVPGVVLGLVGLLLLVPAAPVSAQDVSFGEPRAEAELGLPLIFSTSLRSANEPQNVELVVRLPSERALTVMPATVRPEGNEWLAEAEMEGHIAPNTRFTYRFRVSEPSGAVVLGPEAETIVRDTRFEWRTIEGDIVRLHWYDGEEAFARRALGVAELAVTNASELLGVVETEPIDLFIYDSEQPLREALGSATRENVGGQAHPNIRTMFALIESHERDATWVDTVVAHELTHLVFDTATDNPYHSPPRWLNEGVAVYLSEGYTREWRAVLNDAVARRSIIPLEGLGGLFPTTGDQFLLAYAESVAALDFFIAQYGEPTLWSLVVSYSQGVSDDEAFRAATGGDLAQFNQAWMQSLGLDVPQPVGPQPGSPGPLPPGWDPEPGSAPATPAPGTTTGPGVPATAAPATSAPGPTPLDGGNVGDQALVMGLLAGIIVVIGVAGAALIVRRRLLT